MKLVRVAGATLNQTPLDWEGNWQRVAMAIKDARNQGVEILCLPELALTGYGCEDMFFAPELLQRAQAMLQRVLDESAGMVILAGLPLMVHGRLYNCAALVQNGRILGLNAKKNLPRDGVHYEPRWFQPWPKGRKQFVRICEQDVAVGDLRYVLGDVALGVEICEEAWGPENVSAAHLRAGLQIVLNPSASHFALGKYAVRERLVADRSRAMQVHYVYSNLVGNEAGRIIYDGGVLIAECGDIVARGRRFGFSDLDLTTYDLNLDLAQVGQMRMRSVSDLDLREPWDAHTVVGDSPVAEKKGPQIDGKVPSKVVNKVYIEPQHLPEMSRNEEFLWAQMLGLFDYVRKSKSRGFVVSLSGGCDSSAVSVLIAHMISQALKDLGPVRLAAAFGLAQDWQKVKDDRQWIHQLLTCVYSSTKQSSSTTSNAARSLAENIGASFLEDTVEPIVVKYVGIAEQFLAREITWETDDIALQNIQARCRAPLVWLLANIKGALLVATSNRSEAAVGYATMDGDTAGGIAPLAGIDKRFLRQFLNWCENQNSWGLGALPSLALVNSQLPTAELRPNNEQLDETDLMPYQVLERIERLFVRDKMGSDDILRCIVYEFKDMASPEVLESYVKRFLKLWRLSQWKRERMAPGFHVDDESLDPKTWCRYPILSGTNEL